jgi:hypothetical protein
VFGLGKDRSKQPAASTAPTVQKPGGKGRATPTRRDAEQRNRTPLIGAARTKATAPGATRAERKQAKAQRRDAIRAERGKARAAMLAGDERYLPARDRGPARRWVRDYIDARRNPGEYFLPVALVVVVLTMAGVPTVAVVAGAALYVMMFGLMIDSVLLHRRIKGRVVERFGEQAAAGAGGYGLMRALQLRRSRMPRPRVARGKYPQ